MPEGTFQGGLITTEWMAELSIGVSSPGLPETAFIDSTGLSSRNRGTIAAPEFTCTRVAGIVAGSQRQRSMLAMICRTRWPTGWLREKRAPLPPPPVGL